MDINRILSSVDHTLLTQTATWSDIKAVCDDSIKYNTASVCIPPSYVKKAKEYVGDKLQICTVIGFPNGYSTTSAKCFEASDAVSNGADEIDMVINLGYVKEGNYDQILDEINAIKRSCGDKTLKVIIETCLLTEDEKTTLCDIISKSNADFIKTSTGFSNGGATKEDIKLFADNIYGDLKIKAAGGISTLQDAEDFLNLGACRLGTSRIVKIVKQTGEDNEYEKDTSY